MFKIPEKTSNKDLNGLELTEAKKRYLDIWGDFESKLGEPEYYECPDRKDIYILDFAKGHCGLKAFGAEKLVAEVDASRPMGYAAPRVGHAAEAISYLAEVYNKKAVFFAPASKEVSAHQAVVMAYKKSDLRFVRIPAMPTLNAWIRKWAEQHNGVALPFGLANTPVVTAGLAAMCDRHMKKHGEPTQFYCAVSTGTMIRALQIGWPNAEPVGVAVARNLKDGEIGRANVVPYHKGFYQCSDFMPPFNTTATYDAKAYKRFLDEAKPGSVFINVGSDQQINSRLSQLGPDFAKNFNSQIGWDDRSAFDRP